MHRRTHELALAGMFTALAAAFLWMSGLLPLSTYCWPILASLTLIPVREECRPSYAWCSFAAGALLGVLLCADKEAAVLYCFLGYYPLLKPKFDAIGSSTVRFLAKLALCVFTVGAMYYLLIFVLALDALVQEFSSSAPLLLAAAGLLGIILFFLYDTVLLRFSRMYQKRKLRKK